MSGLEHSTYDAVPEDADDEFEDAEDTRVAAGAGGDTAVLDDDVDKDDTSEEDTGLLSLSSLSTEDPPVQDTMEQCQNMPQPRQELPVPRPTKQTSLWQVLKSAVGRDLTRITMPVQFNEPLSFLQRLCEDLEYAHLLDRAAECDDPVERACFVGAFANAMFASSASGLRVYKAFNPLLGETYELVRPDLGWRVICEQVSHHPPVTAMHAESVKGWTYRQEYRAQLKFRGSLQVVPTGICVCELAKFDDVFSWLKPPTTVHNLFVGKIYLDQEGVVEVKNHTNNVKCRVLWRPYGDVGRHYLNLSAHVYDDAGRVRKTMHGRWDMGLAVVDKHIPVSKLPPGEEFLKRNAGAIIWSCNPPHDRAAEMYGMTTFSIGLNQEQPVTCPTDSRLRPDQRALENGDVDLAISEKRRLEEKQRSARKQRQQTNTVYRPKWFVVAEDSRVGCRYHAYSGLNSV